MGTREAIEGEADQSFFDVGRYKRRFGHSGHRVATLLGHSIPALSNDGQLVRCGNRH